MCASSDRVTFFSALAIALLLVGLVGPAHSLQHDEANIVDGPLELDGDTTPNSRDDWSSVYSVSTEKDVLDYSFYVPSDTSEEDQNSKFPSFVFLG